jgi:YidC/Oxa1 family membrane protein insertase
MFMPVIFTFMFLNFPSGLVLYWLTNSLVSTVLQLALKKRLEA